MLKREYFKFVFHYKNKGGLYAFYRGFKYILFTINKHMPERALVDNVIESGRLTLLFNICGIKIFWEGKELTQNIGLNIAICTLGAWTDSSKGKWKIIEKSRRSMVIKNKWHQLPLTLVWHLIITDEKIINWRVELEVEEDIKIDKLRVLSLLNSNYKRCLGPGIDTEWTSSKDLSIIGETTLSEPWLAVSPKGHANNYPGIIYKIMTRTKAIRPLLQQVKFAEAVAPLLGFDLDYDSSHYYHPGIYELLSEEIFIAETSFFNATLNNIKKCVYPERNKGNKASHIKTLLVNLPWQKGERWGVRAGSRWPHIKDNAEEGNYLPFPFFMAHSASLLRMHGFEVHLIDAIADKISENKLVSRIERMPYDLLVVETSTPSLNYDLALLKRLGNKYFKICLCGPDGNIRTPEFLKGHDFIDYIFVGEYESSLLKLVKNISEGKELKDVSGLIYRDGQTIRFNPSGQLVDLDTLPWPLREGLPMDKYLDTPGGIPKPSFQMLASRGCPFKCSFCLWPQIMYQGNKYRARDIKDVVDEMEYLVNSLGAKSIYFDDDTFNVGKERMLEFCREIKKRNLERIPWAIMARADLMDEEILVNMKEAGLVAVKYGVESADQELLDSCGKGMNLKKAKEMILFTQKLGIKTHLTFTFGLPGETHATIQKTIDYALEAKPFSVQFSITTPFPGTRYYQELDKKGLVINKNFDDYDGNFKSVIKLDSLSSKDLEEARRKAYLAWDKLSFSSPALKEYSERLKESYRQGGLMLSLHRALRYLKKHSLKKVLDRIRSGYLEEIGVFNGRYAFKGPNTIQIDLTDYCNNNCLACWCNSPLLSKERLNKPKDMLPKSLVKSLIAETHQMGLREIYFSGGGEPFMHPDILEIIQYAKGLGISCSVNTNFTLIDEEMIDKLIELGLDNLTVSIWAADAKVYKALHPNKDESDFYRIRNILYLLNSKKEKLPRVKIYNVICNINYRQIVQMFDFAREVKSEFVEFTVVDTIPGATEQLILSEEQNKYIWELLSRIKDEPANSSDNHRPQILNLEHFIRRVSNPSAKQSEYDSQFIESMPCYVGWLFARIMPNGDVNSCLKSHRFPIGNIHQQSFKEIWNSDKQRYFREKTLKASKDDSFFSLIGNDPKCKIGCYKSCDDISRNISLHNKIKALSAFEKYMLKILSARGPGRPVGKGSRI